MNQRSSESLNNGRTSAGPGGKWRLATGMLALALGAFGMALFGGGVWLMALGGSWYYTLTGAGCVATTVLLWRQRIAAVYLFAVIWGLTLIWALWEVGLNWWGLVPRLVAITLILLLILAVSPSLRRTPRSAA